MTRVCSSKIPLNTLSLWKNGVRSQSRRGGRRSTSISWRWDLRPQRSNLKKGALLSLLSSLCCQRSSPLCSRQRLCNEISTISLQNCNMRVGIMNWGILRMSWRGNRSRLRISSMNLKQWWRNNKGWRELGTIWMRGRLLEIRKRRKRNSSWRNKTFGRSKNRFLICRRFWTKDTHKRIN